MTIPSKAKYPVVYMARHKNRSDNNFLVWPQSEFINNLNSRTNIDEKLANRIVDVLTSGSCTNYSKCYRPIEKYKTFINEKNVVFGISYKSIFDVTQFESRILQNNWHFISDGGYWKKDADFRSLTAINKLFKLYGINIANNKENGLNIVTENICRDL